jgi:hypothetical protein
MTRARDEMMSELPPDPEEGGASMAADPKTEGYWLPWDYETCGACMYVNEAGNGQPCLLPHLHDGPHSCSAEEVARYYDPSAGLSFHPLRRIEFEKAGADVVWPDPAYPLTHL